MRTELQAGMGSQKALVLMLLSLQEFMATWRSQQARILGMASLSAVDIICRMRSGLLPCAIAEEFFT